MPSLASKANSSSGNFSLRYDGDADTLDGAVILRPDSIHVFGTGATGNITRTGAITFDNIQSIRVNNVYNSNYHTYIIYLKSTLLFQSGFSSLLYYWNTLNETESTTGYRTQSVNYVLDQSPTLIRSASSETIAAIAGNAGADQNFSIDYSMSNITIYRPSLVSPTVLRNISATYGYKYGLYDLSVYHSESISYNSFGLYIGSGGSDRITGTMIVYGYGG